MTSNFRLWLPALAITVLLAACGDDQDAKPETTEASLLHGPH